MRANREPGRRKLLERDNSSCHTIRQTWVYDQSDSVDLLSSSHQYGDEHRLSWISQRTPLAASIHILVVAAGGGGNVFKSSFKGGTLFQSSSAGLFCAENDFIRVICYISNKLVDISLVILRIGQAISTLGSHSSRKLQVWNCTPCPRSRSSTSLYHFICL